MRFLQLEWHAHERARNAWDIERAEMKSKIAKQEGESRQAKRINEQLVKHIKMLQKQLKKEREKNATGNGSTDTPEVNAEEQATNGKKDSDADGQADISARHNSILAVEKGHEVNEKEREQYLDNTRKYLKECMDQINYLLTPPPQQPPQPMLPNGNYTGLPDPPLSVEDIYVRNQQRNRMPPGQGLQQQSQMPNHMPPPIPNSLPQSGSQQDTSRGQRQQDLQDGSQQPSDAIQRGSQDPQTPYDEPAESVTHSFDSRGRAIPPNNDQRQGRQQPEADGWTFDEEPGLQQESIPPDMPQPRRPDTDLFPSAGNASQMSAKSPPRTGSISHRRKSSGSQAMGRRRSSQGKDVHAEADAAAGGDPTQFKVKFALRGHLDVVRSVIFSGGGSPSEPEVCTAGDDGTIKRWIIPASYQNFNAPGNNADLDVGSTFTHRGHDGIVTSLTTYPASTGFSTGGRACGDGWIFSGGQDATIRAWERGRVDPMATLEGHTDCVWSVCILPASVGVVFGPQSSNFGGPDRLLLVSGSADGTVKVWAVTSPPQSSSPSTGSRRGVGGTRRHSVTSGSNHPTEPQPSAATTTNFYYTLIHSIQRPDNKASPTSICPLSPSGETFVVAYADSVVIVWDTRTGEQLAEMASSETYDGTMNTSINTVVATSLGLEGAGPGGLDANRGLEPEEMGGGATGGREGVEGVVITGHEDRFVRFFDANSGMPSCSPNPTLAASLTLCRSSDIYHARPSIRHLLLIPIKGRTGSSIRRSRCKHPFLVSRETNLYAGHRLPSCCAWRRRVRCRLVPRWETGS
jgi:striatin 1/3/4